MLCNSRQYQRGNIACSGRKASFGCRGHGCARRHDVIDQENRATHHAVAAFRVGADGAGDRFESGLMSLSFKASCPDMA